MKQLDGEKKMLDALFQKKSKVPYDFLYKSTSVENTVATLGTIEADAAGRYGRWDTEPFRASQLANLLVENVSKGVLLDIGGGNLLAANFFQQNGFEVHVNDFSTSPYLSAESLKNAGIKAFIEGDFNNLSFADDYDVVWTSHVLEHQLNVHDFLRKLVSVVKEGGYIAIAVPPRKPFLVSGHVNLFTPGLLVYRCILAGLDCSEAQLFQYDGNICILIRVRKISLPRLNYDIGDLDLLAQYFPFAVEEGANGDVMNVNY